MNRLAPLMSSAKDDWQTPDNILDLVRQVGDIYLDPCTTNENPVGAPIFCVPPAMAEQNFSAGCRQVDGLKSNWTRGNALIYVNPPYGRQIGKWTQKCSAESRRGDTIIALVPARTDARWFQDAQPDAICFWAGRLTFRGAPSAAPFPSALLFWGKTESRRKFAQVFAPHGLIWDRKLPLVTEPCGCRIETLTYICAEHFAEWQRENTEDAEEGTNDAEG